jgi:hypothetical protein
MAARLSILVLEEVLVVDSRAAGHRDSVSVRCRRRGGWQQLEEKLLKIMV